RTVGFELSGAVMVCMSGRQIMVSPPKAELKTTVGMVRSSSSSGRRAAGRGRCFGSHFRRLLGRATNSFSQVVRMQDAMVVVSFRRMVCYNRRANDPGRADRAPRSGLGR